MSKNLDETIYLQSEKRQEWIREVRGGERLYKGWLRTGVLHPALAKSLVASLARRNECSRIHCSLIIQVEREDSFFQMFQRV